MKNNLKRLRLSKGMSQEQLAEKSGLSSRTIQRIEAGEDTSVESMNILANALGVEFTTLFIEDNENDVNKLENAEAKLDYQLNMRRREYKGYDMLINGIWTIIMLGFIPVLIISGNGWWLWMLWGVAWALFYSIYQFFVITFIDPKLDKKYPLTKFRTDKNKEND